MQNKKSIENSNMLLILKFIKEYEEKNDSDKGWRKVTELDVISKPKNNKLLNNGFKKKNEKIVSFRMQEEFGPKKRIKP